VRWWTVTGEGRRLWLSGAVLAAAAVVLFALRDSLTMEVQDLLLLVALVTGISFAVGWVLGYLAEGGLAPGPGERE
jgi:hypothetical protein